MTITLALPSKGRLKDQATEALARAGLVVEAPSDARQYNARIKDFEKVEIAYLSASEIAREVGEGHVDLGVTGEDLLCETFADWSERTEIAARLGFGRADVVVAVPDCWIDVARMADLEDVAAQFARAHGRRLRVATKYLNLTRRFFARAGVAGYRIVESVGATEGTPAAGTSELIVDITTTGTTLKANHLKVLEDGLILKSQAHLFAARGADWTEEARGLRNAILDRLSKAV
jgi:ATP phosphoribosyltransferase